MDAGQHPVASRYLKAPAQREPLFALALGQCTACGLVQLTTLVPPDQLIPPFDWITYNEPEGHLDAVADKLALLPGLGSDSVIGAITYKDDSTLKRLEKRGLGHGWRVDVSADLRAPAAAGLASIQARLPERARTVSQRYGKADLLIVRHVLEHAQDTRRFAAGLRELVRPGGYLMFEVPDCSQVLDTLDYTTIWEEHVLYFTIATYRLTLEALGFEIVGLDSYPYPYENSLVAVVRNVSQPTPQHDQDEVERERKRGRRFAAAFPHRRHAVQATLAERCRNGARVALFGAGHLACMFINLNDVSNYITFVVDDHPRKLGLFMPGSGLPIKESRALLPENIVLCLSSLSPESEEKVVTKLGEFMARDGEFASIFPSSRRAFRFAAKEGMHAENA